MYLNTHIFPTTGHTRVLLFMFTRLEHLFNGSDRLHGVIGDERHTGYRITIP